jgi:hypothetical protein
MSIAMLAMRAMGWNVDLEAMLGSLLEPHVLLPARLAGCLLHLVIGTCMGLLYGAAFELAIQRSGVLAGAGLSLSHALLAGLFMSGIPAMNPFGPASSAAPGAFLSNLQYGPAIFVVLHLLYGAVVGLAYGEPLQKPHEATGEPDRLVLADSYRLERT